MFSLMLLLAAPVAAAPEGRATIRPLPDVVVTAPPFDALAACLARHCPPAEEAAAVLAVANAHYTAGDYAAARQTVEASLARLRGETRDHPEPYADLLSALARLDAHLGLIDDYVVADRRAWLLMRDAFGATDPRTIERRLTLAGALLDGGQQAQAATEFAGAVADADAGGDAAMRALSRVRYATAILREPDAGGERARVARLLAPMLAGTEPGLADYRLAAQVVTARIAARHGDPSALAAATAAVAAAAPTPVLASAEQPRLRSYRQDDLTCQPASAELAGGTNSSQNGASSVLGCDDARAQLTPQPFDKQWLDVTFTVAQDGRVGDVGIDRQSGEIDRTWVDEALRVVAARRYASGGGEPRQRRERVTLTARYFIPTGSRIAVREPRPIVEVVDISADRRPYLSVTR